MWQAKDNCDALIRTAQTAFFFFLAEGFKLLEVVSDGLEVIQLLF